MPPPEPAIVDLHFTVFGTRPGPPLVLLHGLASSGADWELQVPAFTAIARVIAPDLRGHGHSPMGLGRPSVAAMAADVAALLARLGEPPAHVVGLSLGGCVAQMLALGHPERVRSLVLVNTFGRLPVAGAGGLRRFAQRGWLLLTAPMPAVAAHVAQGLFPRPEQAPARAVAVARLGTMPRRAYLTALRAIAGFNSLSSGRLAGLRCPVLVVCGDRDQTVPRRAVDALCAALPTAELAVVADSGHATPIDQPEAFNRLVLDFVQRH
jgi:3-oxoadipate enol-lactonase